MMQEGSAHCWRGYFWAGGPGCRVLKKQVEQEVMGKQARYQHPLPHQLLAAGSSPARVPAPQ